jgi:DNA-binding response OmpR family regulator
VNRASPATVVLLVEDEGIVRTALAVELEAAGWTVVEAATGEAALAIGRKQHCDMLISDIHLGGYLSGWEVAEGLRAVKPGIPVIYMSGKSVEKSRMVPGSVF